MKKLVIILIIFLSVFGSAYSQWVKVCDTYSGGVDGFANNGSYIYALVTGDGVYRSTNYGENWVFIYSGFGGNNMNAIAAKDNYVFVAGESGIFRSTNFGINWSLLKIGKVIR